MIDKDTPEAVIQTDRYTYINRTGVTAVILALTLWLWLFDNLLVFLFALYLLPLAAVGILLQVFFLVAIVFFRKFRASRWVVNIQMLPVTSWILFAAFKDDGVNKLLQALHLVFIAAASPGELLKGPRFMPVIP